MQAIADAEMIECKPPGVFPHRKTSLLVGWVSLAPRTDSEKGILLTQSARPLLQQGKEADSLSGHLGASRVLAPDRG